MSNIPDREGRWGRILGEDTKRARGQEMGKSDKAEKTAGGIPQRQMSASLPTWPGSPPSPSPSSGLPVACSTPAVSLQVAVLRSWPNATAVRSGLLCYAHSRRLCYCCKESLPSLYTWTFRNSSICRQVDKSYICSAKAEYPTGCKTCP